MTAVPSRVRRFNGEDDCTLNLQRRGVTMDADFLTANGNPLVAICNYVFDTLTSVSSPTARGHTTVGRHSHTLAFHLSGCVPYCGRRTARSFGNRAKPQRSWWCVAASPDLESL